MDYEKKIFLFFLILLNITIGNVEAFRENAASAPSEEQEKVFRNTKIALAVLTGTACLLLPSVWNLSKEIRSLNTLEAFAYHKVIETIVETDNTLKISAAAFLMGPLSVLAWQRKEQLPASKKELLLNKTMLCATIVGFALGWQLKNALVDHFNKQLPPIVFKITLNRA